MLIPQLPYSWSNRLATVSQLLISATNSRRQLTLNQLSWSVGRSNCCWPRQHSHSRLQVSSRSMTNNFLLSWTCSCLEEGTVFLCRLTAKLLLVLASTMIFGAESDGTHDHILLSEGSRSLQTLWSTHFKSKSHYDRRSGGQAVLMSSPIWGTRPDFCYCHTFAVLSMWGALFNQRTGLSFVAVTVSVTWLLYLQVYSESELLYDWRFTANRFVLAPSLLRFTTEVFFLVRAR
jgi:hypothetical protein